MRSRLAGPQLRTSPRPEPIHDRNAQLTGRKGTVEGPKVDSSPPGRPPVGATT